MAQSTIQNSFVSGEISPSLFGRTDLKKYHSGASTMRNFYANYRGGAASRAGLAYVGMCKQPGTAAPPRDIPFQFNINQGYALEFGDSYMRVKSNGAYILEAPKSFTAATNASPGVFTIPAHGFVNGDWIHIVGMGGMTRLNGITWIVTAATLNTFELTDLFGVLVNTTLFGVYTSGGTASRVYTTVAPYAAVDLPYLKFTQSADTMSLTCVNQATGAEYPPYELVRNGLTNWVFTATSFASSIAAPTGVGITVFSSANLSTFYSYVVTAVSTANGDESIASTPASAENNDISINAGSNKITYNTVTGAGSYNIYKAVPSYNVAVPAGVSFGFAGTSTGLSFVDTNITADFTQTPPLHTDPFTPGGPNPASGTYPGVVAYFQQRRGYANTQNRPDTYFFSQPDSYKNFDSSKPSVDSDAVIGAPWAQQINGIQFMVPMPSGLIVLTGSGAWLLNGSSGGTLTPSSQIATAEAYNGCSATIPPIVINYDILYVQSKGSIVRDLSYNFFVNIYTGEDKTILANHLFDYHQLQQWAWAEEPFKVVWATRNDGVCLSLTYLKEQEVYAWARHDTDGAFIGVCSITEPPINAVYFITRRHVRGVWVYYSERMDNRNWHSAEDCFCVDAGLSYPRTYPNATLTPAAAVGTNNISSANVIIGGSGYTAPVVTAIDPTGQGTGATFSATLSSGVITAITVLTQGQNYRAGGVTLQITDTTGSGAVAQAIVTNNVDFFASSSVFSAGNVGNVIRIGNSTFSDVNTGVALSGSGKAIITSYISGTHVVANIVEPITAVVPNNPDNMPVPAIPNEWSIAVPTSIVHGLDHLEGLEVAILADGSVVPNQTVVDGTIVLPHAYSAISIGLPYTCQLQTLYLDPEGPTSQGKRKNVNSVVVRMESSRGLKVSTNQPDQSTQPDNALVPWTNMKEIKERNALITAGNAIPLFTGDHYINVPSDWNIKGQVAIEQSYPLPANISAVIVQFVPGDTGS